MKIMLLLILISLLLAAGFLLVYLWAARNGQFDDDYTPSVRILFEDASAPGYSESPSASTPPSDVPEHGQLSDNRTGAASPARQEEEPAGG